MDSYKDRFAAIVRKRRLDMKLTQEELAEMLDITAPYMGELERGKNNPSFTLFCDAVKKLGFSADEMIGAEDAPHSPTYWRLMDVLGRCSEEQLQVILATAVALTRSNDTLPDGNNDNGQK